MSSMPQATFAHQHPNGSLDQVDASTPRDLSGSSSSPLPSEDVPISKPTQSSTSAQIVGSIVLEDVKATPTFGYTVLLIFGMVTFALSYGMPTSTSAFFLDWQDTFQVSRAQAAMVHATCLGILNAGAIIPGYMMNRFGARPTLLTGSCLATSGLLLSVFASSITQMIICNGVLTGLGFCMLNLPVIPCVTQAFSSRRSLIISCLSFGSSISNAGLTYFYRYLADQLSWQGAFFILSGIAFNSCVTGLVITSYTWKPISVSPQGVTGGEEKQNPPAGKEIPRSLRQKLCSDEDSLSGSTISSETDRSDGRKDQTECLYYDIFPNLLDSKKCQSFDNGDEDNQRMYSKDQDHFKNYKEGRYEITSSCLLDKKSRDGSGNTDDEEIVSPSDNGTPHHSQCYLRLNNSKFSFLLHPLYILVVVNTALCIPCIGAVIFLVLDFAENKGFMEESSGVFFLFIAFLFSAVGKVVCGLLNLVPKLKSVFIMAAFGSFGALALVLLTYFDSYGEIAFALALLGLCYGGLAGIYPKCVLDSDSVDAKTFPLALGIANSAEGVFDSSTPILMGFLVDLQGSYTFPLLLFAVVCSVATILLLVTYFCHQRKQFLIE